MTKHVRPYDEGKPETSPIGQYALMLARYGESNSTFEYSNMNHWEYTIAVRNAREQTHG